MYNVLLHLNYFTHIVAGATVQCPDGSSSCDTGLPTVQATSASLQSILQVVFGILGGMAVIMIMYGGLKFVLANGDPAAVSKAKKTVIYSVVGLAIAIVGETLVSFLLGKLP